MDGSAVQKIAELEDHNKIVEVNGITYAREDFKPIFHIPRPRVMNGKTLTGLVDYIKVNREEVPLDKCMLQVIDHTTVELVEAFRDEDDGRTIFYRAKLDEKLPEFKFDQYMGIEEFIIKARALFQSSEDLNMIITIVSRVTAQNEIITGDNGLSQSLQVKKGVSGALTEGINTQGTYLLRPYRTFRELDQPESNFILRLKAVEGGLPTVALFDADGGSWRYDAMQSVKEFLDSQELGIPVYA